MLLAFNSKIATNGIVVYNSYTRFFNTDNEACATARTRASPPGLATPSLRYNSLTSGLNDLIYKVIYDVADEYLRKILLSLRFEEADIDPVLKARLKEVRDSLPTHDLDSNGADRFLLPDFFGRIFHPNEAGHNAIASFAIAKTIDLRAQVLGRDPRNAFTKIGHGYDAEDSDNLMNWKFGRL
ncbi:hypothetical protein NEMBOFW57_004134 [Staphylotrichum longicolle]|uniref:Uncharacterized protein n=1 Tax=Staphylotrichum longicolle TaxID=669026 RepID=A0AAD4F6K5_9PEZI|nr:hypothetical protein NEMBOFW57_004134 [Staphylotrichum longicolle]